MAKLLPGSLYSLPLNFFESSAVEVGSADTQDVEAASSTQLSTKPVTASWEGGATCLTCGIGVNAPGFKSPEEQRAHFKSDWHRYNVKRKLQKQEPVSEDQFEQLLEKTSNVSSISGSDTDSDASDDDEEGGRQLEASTSGPQAVFTSKESTAFAVWKCLLVQDHVKGAGQTGQLLDELRRLRKSSGLWLVILFRGGHFAAGVFRPKEVSPSSNGIVPDAFETVAHKTFHRYVVRAKAGGKQSSKDATGKFAKSAGSRIRRHNEQALDRDIAGLLQSWQQYVQAADLIFVHAPSSNSKSIFGSGPGPQPLSQSDPRVRRIPFMTRRPTFSEAKRALTLLSTVFERSLQQQAVAAAVAEGADKAAACTGAGAKGEQQEAQAGAVHGSSEDKGDRGASAGASAASVGGHPGEGQGAAAEGAAAAAAAAGERKKEPPIPDTPLHKAARSGDAERVRVLLEEGHDPTAKDSKGKVPYQVAEAKAVRDMFRRFMAGQPERWDWGAAAVPSALTDELEEAQQAKKAEKKARLKARDKERKAEAEERKKAEEEQARAAFDAELAAAVAAAAALSVRTQGQGPSSSSSSKPAGRQVGAGPAGKASGSASGSRPGQYGSGSGRPGSSSARPGGQGQRKQEKEAAPPTPEELAKRREMMAAAAEARMRALQQASQQQKLW